MGNKGPASQQFVPIEDIRDGVVVLKSGQMNMVLLASSINFALKSVDEQKAILGQFQSLLNTLDFSLQFHVQSRKLNIEPYLELLAAQESRQDNDLMNIQLREYIEFIRTFTNEVDIMSKNFFVVVPYSPIQLDVKKSIGALLGTKKEVNLDDKSFEEHRSQLEQRVSIVEHGLGRIGIRTVALDDDALVELYYHIFNPQDRTGSAPKTK